MIRNGRLWVDPRTKLILILSVNGIIVTGVTSEMMMVIVIFMAVILFASGQQKAAIQYFVGYVLLWGTGCLVSISGLKSGITYIGVCTALISKAIPALMSLTVFISTTTVSELATALGRMRMHDGAILPFLVVIRFFPTVSEEWSCIKDAMKIRGINTGLRFFTSFGKSMEHILVPLITTSVKIGEELTASALTRGLGAPVRRTNSCEVGFHLFDIIIIAVSMCFFVLINF